MVTPQLGITPRLAPLADTLKFVRALLTISAALVAVSTGVSVLSLVLMTVLAEQCRADNCGGLSSVFQYTEPVTTISVLLSIVLILINVGLRSVLVKSVEEEFRGTVRAAYGFHGAHKVAVMAAIVALAASVLFLILFIAVSLASVDGNLP